MRPPSHFSSLCRQAFSPPSNQAWRTPQPQRAEEEEEFPQRQEEEEEREAFSPSPTSEAEVWTSPPEARRSTRISENNRDAADDAGVYDSLEGEGVVGEWEQPDDEMTSGGGMTSGSMSFEGGGQGVTDSGASSPVMDGTSKSRRGREGFGQELTNSAEFVEPRLMGGGYAVQG